MDTDVNISSEEVVPGNSPGTGNEVPEENSGTENVQKKGKPSLKVVKSKRYMGPVPANRDSRKTLSKASNRIRINNDFKVSLSSSSDEDKKKGKPGFKAESKDYITKSLLETKSEEEIYKTALAIMQAWSEVYTAPGDDDYVRAANIVSKTRAEIYDSMGIHPQKGIKPTLTEEQRLVYDKEMRKVAFPYYEVRLSFKQPGYKAIRSKTFKFRNDPDLEPIITKLARRAMEILKTVDITVKKDGD
jgi:hypothetical protein